jgi:hypothetical protein
MTHNDTNLSSINLFLNSKFANEKVNGKTANCKWYLDRIIAPAPHHRILMCITDCELPYSFFIFNSKNNTLVINKSGTGNITYTLPVGNYNITTLIDAFNKTTDTLYSAGITASYDSRTNKISFAASVNLTLDLTLSTIKEEIGFSTASTANVITGDNMVNLAGLPNIFLRAKNIGIENYDSNSSVTNTLAKINVDVLPLQYIFYRPTENVYAKVSDRQITSINLALEDENGEQINMNGQDWSCTITIHYQYEREAKPYKDIQGDIQGDNVILEVKETETKK